MKRLLRVFEFTVAEKCVIVVVFMVVIAFATLKTYRGMKGDAYPAPTAPPSAQPPL